MSSVKDSNKSIVTSNKLKEENNSLLVARYSLLNKIACYSLLVTFFLFTIHYSLFTDTAHALEFKKHTLPNGLTLLHVERHYLPIVMVTLLIKASPLNEPEEKAGLAHLTSKMLLEGTEKRKSLEISDEIEFIGASMSTAANSDYTTLSLSVLKRDVEKGFDLLFDVLLNPAFPDNEIKRKKDLIKGALKQKEEEPSFLAERAFLKEVFGSHPYGRRVEGSIESLDNIKREDIINFHSSHYQPQNAAISVVGALSAEELNSLMNKHLGQWKAEQQSRRAAEQKSRRAEEKHKEKKIIVINKDITQANIVLGHKGISREDPDYYAVAVMNYILGGGGFASRLMKVVRDEMGLTYSIHSSFVGNKEAGYFEVEAQTKNEQAGVVVKEILNQLKRIRTEPVSDRQLNDAKAFLTGSFPRRLETSRRIADFLTAVEFYNLGEDYVRKYPEYINSVTKEDVLRVAKKHLNPENYVLVIVGNKSLLKL